MSWNAKVPMRAKS